jgi:phenylpropionate dioxygenase-like ring-hydroxylating dioxygenase large terminal subunit
MTSAIPIRTATSRQLAPPQDCSFTASDWAVLSQHWYPLARVQDITEHPLAAKLLDVDLVVYRTPGGLHVARDVCAHRGVPMSMGWVEGDEIVCRYHGLRYGPDGQCTKIPAQPDLRPSPRFCLARFPAVERYGLLWTCLNPEAQNSIPPFEAWNDADYQPILPPPVDIHGSAGRQVEGFIDVAHFAWVHHEAFADRDMPEVPSYQTEVTDNCVRSEYWSSVSNFPKALQDRAPPDFRWLRVYEIFPPFTARLTVHFPNGGRLGILNAASPVSARETRLFVPIARNFDKSGSLDAVYAFNAQIFEEDKAIVEHQRPAELPLAMDAEAHFAADRTSTAYRRWLVKMGLGR